MPSPRTPLLSEFPSSFRYSITDNFFEAGFPICFSFLFFRLSLILFTFFHRLVLPRARVANFFEYLQLFFFFF